MVYFIGIKGSGMAALACILSDLHIEVSGSDIDKHIFTEDSLRLRQIPIYPFDVNNIKDGMTVIIGNAFNDDFCEAEVALHNPTVKTYRYHEYLGELILKYHSFCVAGSHGKTTTTGMLSSMLDEFESTGYLIGDGTGKISEDSQNLVVEACEYCRHFLAYQPEYVIITNIEIDHVDYFKSEEDYNLAYEEFCQNVKKGVVLFGDDPNTHKIKINIPHYFYGVGEENDIRAINVIETSEKMSFDVLFSGKLIGHFDLPFVGHHMLYNSLGVIALGILEGLDPKRINEGLARFTGVKRRFVIEKFNDNIFIDDYAHHPTEVAVTIDTARKRYPGKKLIAIFKPHRVSRVYYFADQFAKALSKADEVYLCDFSAIDDREEGVDLDIDISYLQKLIPGSCILEENEAGAKVLAQLEPAVYLFMSSKDIYGLSNLVKRYQKS